MSADKNIKQPKGPVEPGELIRFVEELKRQWVATIDALVDPLMFVTTDYTVHKANKALAKLAGLDVREVIGQKCYRVFADRSSACPGCTMQQSIKNARPDNFGLEKIRSDRYYEVTSQPITDAEGGLEGVVQVYRDRTNAKRMQEQLQQQEKLASIGLLAGGIAHEINNPLGGILIFSQMLLREMDKKSPHYPDVVEIEAATQRCKGIVENLLEFARQRRSTKNEKVPVDVIEAAKSALRFGKVGIKARCDIEIEDKFDSHAHIVTGDHNKLIQVFLNLIQNAFQAMPDGGTLTLRSKVDTSGGKRKGLYYVEDTGVGISKEDQKKIFDPFFTTKDPGEGTGLGLAICYGIVQDLGGNLSVESQLNRGTKFIVELPLDEIKEKSAS